MSYTDARDEEIESWEARVAALEAERDEAQARFDELAAEVVGWQSKCNAEPACEVCPTCVAYRLSGLPFVGAYGPSEVEDERTRLARENAELEREIAELRGLR